MIAVFRSEWRLLNRSRMWLLAAATTVTFAATATGFAVGTAEPAAQSPSGGLTLEALAGSGGATAGVTYAVAFGALLILAAFASTVGNEFTRGTFRSSLLHRPGRLELVTGRMAARMAVATALMALTLAAGAVSAGVVASSQDISTTGWFGFEGFSSAVGDFGRLVPWAFGWALMGTALAVLLRSTPVALGVGILWFGPMENVIGDDLAFGERWFPGQLLRAWVSPDGPSAVSQGTAAATLVVYGVVLVAVVAAVVVRRDVTG